MPMALLPPPTQATTAPGWRSAPRNSGDRKSTRLNSSHLVISYAVFCLKKKTLVHADIEVGHDKHRRLQTVGKVEGLRAELERFGRILGHQQHVLGIAVRGVGAEEHVAL